MIAPPFLRKGSSMKRIALFCIFLLVISGCTLLVTKPAVTVKHIKIASMGSGGVDLDLILAVDNPNSFPITLTRYKYNLLVQDVPFVAGEEQRTIEFAKHASTELHVPVNVPVKNLLGILKQKTDPEKIPYTLDAEIEVKTSLLTKVFPVKSSGTFSLPKEYRPVFYLNEIKSMFNGGGRGTRGQ